MYNYKAIAIRDILVEGKVAIHKGQAVDVEAVYREASVIDIPLDANTVVCTDLFDIEYIEGTDFVSEPRKEVTVLQGRSVEDTTGFAYTE